tara:strand:+ start:404 stop:1273 length:870 start_codon:yes stop_codon:yes gene_type:complete
MRFLLRKIKVGFDELVFLATKHKYKFNPVFIIGCGRSGTTILGQTLSQHSKLHYLNERRDLWHKAYPEFNIWSSNNHNLSLKANETHHISSKTKCLRRLFFKEQVLNKSNVLVEKLPINSFRMEFLTTAFPEAKFIYLHRNGMEVSSSIEKAIQKGNWYGRNNIKYKLLEQYARSKNLNFVDGIKSNKEKAMLEWRLSIEATDIAFKNLSEEIYTDLSYHNFTTDFKQTIQKVLDFLNLNYSNELLHKWSKNINVKNTLHNVKDLSLEAIGGPLLVCTINNTYSPKKQL